MIGVRDLSVRFGPVQALDDVSLDIKPGTVHALAGENGSGKTTLLKVMGGVQRPGRGTVVLDGKPVRFSSPVQAAKAGVGMVFQELSLFPHMSAMTNVFVGREPTSVGVVRQSKIVDQTSSLAARIGFPSFDLSKQVSELTVAEQQVVEILKCLAASPSIILFDEPTASLTRREAGPLLDTMRRLRDEGRTVVFVSHYLDELFEVADRVTVLRDGKITMDSAVDAVDPDEVLTAMLGRELRDFYPERQSRPSSEVRVRLGHALTRGLDPIDLDIHVGEVLGVAGTVGSGTALLADMLGGLRPVRAGQVLVDGRPVRLHNPGDALRAGIAYIPEDRRTDALLQDLSVATNVTLPLLAAPRSPLVTTTGVLRLGRIHRSATDAVRSMGVRPPNPYLPVSALSGGNQQKVVLGRWFLRDMPCLILNNPTKGIDVGSKAEIYRHIASLADSGRSVIFVSSYNPELLGVADRILVFFDRHIVGTYTRGDITERELLRATMLGAVEAVGRS